MKDLVKSSHSILRTASLRFYLCLEHHRSSLLLMFGIMLLIGGLVELSSAQETFSEADYDDELVRNAVGNLFRLLEGAFGALIMVVAGLMAVITAAMGSFRTALSMLIVAVGAFILRSLVSLFFGTNFEAFTA